jgi:hypothetical protein
VWFDRNDNGVFDPNEWVLPGVAVNLDDPGVRTTAAFHAEAATVHKTAVTGPDGSYTFSGLSSGPYQVTATAVIKGFDYTSDSDGVADWKVAVNVDPKAPGVADFAGLGRGQLTGRVFEQGTRKGIPQAAIQCVWSGYDDTLGTGDDVTMTVTADGNGSFDMAGVPYGYFSCDGRDRANNRVSTAVAAAVLSPEPVNTPLPLTSATAAPAAAAPESTLPKTGSDSADLTRFSVMLIVTGCASLAAGSRRRRRKTDR